jgi:LmbE family N-acetylglucosaminyl deacetylase
MIPHSGRHAGAVPFTLVAFHAHPDDESLLMGGTIARAAAEGHRVVLVTATDGGAGLASGSMGERAELGRRRLGELDEAAAALGAAKVLHLGFRDGEFSDAGVDEPARALLRILAEEGADLFTGYDPSGGYGHPDHVHVHRVARRVAEQARGLPLLEVTVDRARMVRAARLVSAVPGAPPVDMTRMRAAYLPQVELTHCVDVHKFVPAKLRALAAHVSQQTGGSGFRTVTMLRLLPNPVSRLILGREWFREVGRPVGGRLLDDVFATCR